MSLDWYSEKFSLAAEAFDANTLVYHFPYSFLYGEKFKKPPLEELLFLEELPYLFQVWCCYTV